MASPSTTRAPASRTRTKRLVKLRTSAALPLGATTCLDTGSGSETTAEATPSLRLSVMNRINFSPLGDAYAWLPEGGHPWLTWQKKRSHSRSLHTAEMTRNCHKQDKSWQGCDRIPQIGGCRVASPVLSRPLGRISVLAAAAAVTLLAGAAAAKRSPACRRSPSRRRPPRRG